MEFKGTKGKWVVSENYEVKHNAFSICAINKFTPISDIYKANALLISKAPEMLEMLIDIRDVLENGDTPHIYKIDELIKEATEL